MKIAATKALSESLRMAAAITWWCRWIVRSPEESRPAIVPRTGPLSEATKTGTISAVRGYKRPAGYHETEIQKVRIEQAGINAQTLKAWAAGRQIAVEITAFITRINAKPFFGPAKQIPGGLNRPIFPLTMFLRSPINFKITIM